MACSGACEECGGPMVARPSFPGFSECRSCGKLAVGEPPEAKVSEATEEEFPAEVVVPDFMEVRIGWRAWGVRPGDPVLRSVTHDQHRWPARERMEAVCDAGCGREVPAERCGSGCGIYAAKDLAHLQSMTYHRYDADRHGLYHLIGSIKLWGKVIPGTQGWKARYGYPEQLYLPFEAWSLAAPLQEAYGVPVRLKNILATKKEGA